MAFLKKVFVKEAGTGASPTTAPVPPLATKSVVPGPTYDEEPITLLPKECIEHLKLQKISAADAIADFDILLVCLAADFKQRPEIYKLIKKLAKDRCRAKRNSGEIAAKADPNSGVQPETPKKRLTRTNSAEPLRPSSQRAQYRSPFDDEDDEEDLPPPPPKSSRRQREIEKMKEEWRRKMRGEPTEEEKLKEEWRRKMRGEMTEEEKLKEEWRRKMRGDVADPASGASPPASNPTTPQISRVAQPAQAADSVPGSSTSATTLGVTTAAAQPASAGGSAISAQSAESVTPPLGNQPSPRLVPAFTAPAAGSAPQAPASNSPTDRAAGAATPPADETPEARDKREKKEKKREKKERKRKEAEALANTNAPAAAPAVVAIPTVAAPSAPSAPKGSSPRSADAGKVANPAVTVAPAAATAAAATSTSPVQSNTGAAAPAAAAAVVPVSTSLGAAAPAPVSRDKSPFGRSKDRITKPPVEQLLEIAKQDDPGKFYGDRTRIGKGGFGDVYLASDSRQKKGSRQSQVAIKVSREKISNTFHAELIANEIILLSQCRHKNIVNYLECYLFRERIWMVMEYCDGGTLTELYKGVELNELHFSFIIKAVLLGLQYLHDQNRLHRDIKGENILLNLDGEVKIADLGLAAEAEEKGSGLVGSRYWMSPEMIRREGYDFKTDIWSTGCLVIELCNLEPPYHEYRSMKALFKIATKGAAPLKNPDSFSSPLKSFLAAATQFHPEERPSAAQLLQHPWIVKSGKKEDMMKATEVVFLGNSLRMNGF